MAVALLGALMMAAGCSSPSAANIELRKENQTLRSQLETTTRKLDAEHASLVALESRATTIPILPQAQLETLFTAIDLKLGRLTGGVDLDLTRPGDEALKVYVVPVDLNGDVLKAAGAFTVRAFDLAEAKSPLIGTWSFPASDSAKNWYGDGLLYTYVLSCPWQRLPAHPKLTVKITFVDTLTGRQLTRQVEVTVHPPAPSSESATQPGPAASGGATLPSQP